LVWFGLNFWGKLLNKAWDEGEISLVFNLFWVDKQTAKFITTWWQIWPDRYTRQAVRSGQICHQVVINLAVCLSTQNKLKTKLISPSFNSIQFFYFGLIISKYTKYT